MYTITFKNGEILSNLRNASYTLCTCTQLYTLFVYSVYNYMYMYMYNNNLKRYFLYFLAHWSFYMYSVLYS